MAGTSGYDDYFGVGILGSDPYGVQKQDRVNRLAALSSILSGGKSQQSTALQASPATATSRTTNDPAPTDVNPWISSAANWNQQQGGGKAVGNTPSYLRGGSSTSGLSWPQGMPPDLAPLRTYLSNWFQNQGMQMPAAYPGQLTANVPSYMTAAGDALNGMTGQVNSWLNMGRGTLEEMMKTGGAPDITKALEDMRISSQTDIQNQLAILRENYGKLGLGTGSDVNAGLASGAASGIASLNSAESQLVAAVMQQANANKLQAANTAQGYAQTISGAIQGQAAGAAGLGGVQMQAETAGIQNQYNDWIRTQSPQYLTQLIQYITGSQYGAAKPVYPDTTTNWGNIAATGITAMGNYFTKNGLPSWLGGATTAAVPGAVAGATGATAGSAGQGVISSFTGFGGSGVPGAVEGADLYSQTTFPLGGMGGGGDFRLPGANGDLAGFLQWLRNKF